VALQLKLIKSMIKIYYFLLLGIIIIDKGLNLTLISNGMYFLLSSILIFLIVTEVYFQISNSLKSKIYNTFDNNDIQTSINNPYFGNSLLSSFKTAFNPLYINKEYMNERN
jgi:hypothetical protein